MRPNGQLSINYQYPAFKELKNSLTQKVTYKTKRGGRQTQRKMLNNIISR